MEREFKKSESQNFMVSKDEFLREYISVNKNTPFADILLAHIQPTSKQLEESGYYNDEKEIQIKISINGYDFNIVDFDTVFDDWWGRMESQIKKDLDYLKVENSVNEKAEAVVKERLGSIMDKLQDLDVDLGNLIEKRY